MKFTRSEGLNPFVPGAIQRRHLIGAALLASSWVAVPAFASDVRSQLAAGDYPAVLKLLETRIANNARDIDALFLKGLTLMLMQRDEQAAAVFQGLSQQYPELPEPANNLAVLQARHGRFAEATATLTALLNRHPDYAPAHENLGDVLTAQAEQAYSRASELGSSDAVIAAKLKILRSLSTLPGTRQDADTPAEAPVEAQLVAATPKVSGALPTTAVSAATAATPAPAKSAPSNDTERELLAAVENWRAAWAGGDIETYLALYAVEFEPPREMSREAWADQRRQRIGPDKSVSVVVEDASVTPRRNGNMRVEFIQRYNSPGYSDVVRKRLEFEPSASGWKIRQEVVLP